MISSPARPNTTLIRAFVVPWRLSMNSRTASETARRPDGALQSFGHVATIHARLKAPKSSSGLTEATGDNVPAPNRERPRAGSVLWTPHFIEERIKGTLGIPGIEARQSMVRLLDGWCRPRAFPGWRARPILGRRTVPAFRLQGTALCVCLTRVGYLTLRCSGCR